MLRTHSLRGIYRLTGLVSVLGLLFLVSVASTFAAAPQQVKLAADEFAFTPSTVNLTVGQPIQLTIANTGKVAHDLKSDIPISSLTYQKADNDPDEQKENSENGTLDVDFGVGVTAQVTFTPTKAGTYEFHCDVAGHTEAGMKGTFVVAAAPAAAAQSTNAQTSSQASSQASSQQQIAGATALPKAGDVLSVGVVPWIAVGALILLVVGIGARLALRAR